MNKTPDPPPIGAIVKSHIALPGSDETITHNVGSLFRLVKVGGFHKQGSLGYWAINVVEIKTQDRLATFDDYFKAGHLQSNEMDTVDRPCLFP